MPQRGKKYINSLQNTYPSTDVVFQELAKVLTNNTTKASSPKNYFISIMTEIIHFNNFIN